MITFGAAGLTRIHSCLATNFSRSCTRATNTTGIAPPAGATPNNYGIGPSFDCGTKAVAEQPLAQMICANRELAYWELSYVIAYQALREAATADQRKAMVAEANALVVAINDRCELPRSGALQRLPTDQEVDCIKALFQQEKRTLVERAVGMAGEEALLEPPDTVAIQKALLAQSYLSRTDTIDGVFGHSLGDRFGIAEVVLLSLRVGTHVLRGHQPSIVSKCFEPAAEVMRTHAGLHTDQARRHVGKPCFDLATGPPLSQHDSAAAIQADNME